MSIRIMRAFLPALVVLVFLVFAASPALAANKVSVDRVTNLSIPVGDVFAVLPASICGVAGPFSGNLRINVFQIVVWDNGLAVFSTTNTISLFDTAGNQVLRDRFSLHDVIGPTSLPESFGLSVVSHCTPDSATPGKLYETHITVTVGKDGLIKQIHGAFCDPSAYPFC